MADAEHRRASSTRWTQLNGRQSAASRRAFVRETRNRPLLAAVNLLLAVHRYGIRRLWPRDDGWPPQARASDRGFRVDRVVDLVARESG